MNKQQYRTMWSALVFLFLITSLAGQKIDLFNGKDLAGWEIINNGQFSVENKLLKINKGVGWLRSDKKYGDFKLTMKFRFLDLGANSGIFVRTNATSKDDENGWPDNGYQIQCKDTLDGEFPLGHLIPYGAPEYQDSFFEEGLRSSYNKTGKWNTFEIICEGETMKIMLNKKLITSARDIKNATGHIGIQGEHGRLEFKKIYLTKL